jgi:hypothetical protein
MNTSAPRATARSRYGRSSDMLSTSCGRYGSEATMAPPSLRNALAKLSSIPRPYESFAYSTAARLRPRPRRTHVASAGPWRRSVGQTRNVQGPAPLSSALVAVGDSSSSGLLASL